MNRLKKLRKENNMTLVELSKKLQIPRSTLNRYENEESEPKQETWEKLADYFNVSVGYLMGISDDIFDEATALRTIDNFVKEELSNKENLHDEVQAALEYFNNCYYSDVVSDKKILSYSNVSYILNSNADKKNKELNSNDLSDFKNRILSLLVHWYIKQIPTNQHLIELVYEGIPKNLDDYENFSSPMITAMPLKKALIENNNLISDHSKTKLEDLANNDATLFFSKYEAAIDLNLKNEINTILEETREKIKALKDKYPDNPSSIKQDTKVFVDGREWWQRGEKELSDNLDIPESVKKEIIALGEVLLTKKKTPKREKEDTNKDSASRFYPKESKY